LDPKYKIYLEDLDAYDERESAMKFLVEIELQIPPNLPEEEKAKLLEGHEKRGGELIGDGTITGIWRIPGRSANVGIWEAEDAGALSAAIDSMPTYPFLDTNVRALVG
jgi:muconolactone D-isomerase